MRKKIQILSVVLASLFIGNVANAQTIEFREVGGNYYDGEGDRAVARELKPIVSSLSRPSNEGSSNGVDFLVYYDNVTDASVFSKVVNKKEKDMSGGMIYYKLYKPYKITYNKYNGIFNYKVTLNGTLIYDGPSADSYGVEKPNESEAVKAFGGEKYFFDDSEKTFAGKYGFYASINFFTLVNQSGKYLNLIKEGNNEFKLQVYYGGKLVSEGSMNYLIEKFKLTYENGCNNFNISSTQHKSESAWFTKIVNEKYADEFEDKKAKLISVYVFSNTTDWKPIRDDYNAIIYAEKDVLLIVQDADGYYWWKSRTFTRQYMGGGTYSDNIEMSYWRSHYGSQKDELKDFKPLHSSCFEILKTKYGINK